MTNDLKLKIYPAVIAILGLGLVALLLSRVEVQVARQLPLDRSLEDGAKPPDPASDPPNDSPIDSPSDSIAPIPSASPQPSVSLPPAATVLPAPGPSSAAPAGAQGGLRVSNKTAYPVRVALLYQQSDPKSGFEQPVHWDFAPEEGGAKGLILSLPSGGLRLSDGDVLVAFSQDGSRRYWGPYVVGRTELPTWSSAQDEWVLPLLP
ncbi:MAG: hypothetical protein KME07_02810 [Pegethrix bostrychoides GSE-TBD4-15B]|uniref:Uncharacterized protein n=1 Tax=Pegethrix bostrychoides GSE-TBD4-15B TaxID=2839662 RepID=A0A951U4D9_9CYAN|nr:hypothetical protein [Pegethrix bostrychoides GSE-TBD4-15B]